jgi:glycerophosphoryl diester phosphodiesterase
MVIHDPTLSRTAGVAARVDRTAAADIARLSRAHPTPTLAETMDLLGELGLGANIEIKAVRARRAVVEAVVKTLDAVRRDRLVPVLLSSFSVAILDKLRRLAEHLPRGVLLSRGQHDAIGLARRLGCVSIHEDHRRLTPRHVTTWKAAGFLVVCYTVNDPARARLMFDWGVDSVISDAPGGLAEAVGGGR